MSHSAAPWYAHYEQKVSKSLYYPDLTLGELMRNTVQDYPDRPAVDFLGKTLTFRQLYDEIERFSRYLQRIGVAKGDRVAVMLPNSPQAVIAYYGALQLGAVVVQTNPMYKEQELAFQLQDSEAKMIVCIDLVYERVAAVLAKTNLEHVIVTSVKDYLPFPKNVLYPLKQRQEGIKIQIPDSPTVTRWSNVMNHDLPPLQSATLNPADDLALLQYTGGTTGHPKGVMLTHANLIANTVQVTEWCWRTQKGNERMMAVLPFFHVYGMTAAMNFAVYTAAELILLPKFDAGQVLKTISRKKPTLFPGAPTMYIALLNHPDLKKTDMFSIEACLSGAAPLIRSVQTRFEDVSGGQLVEGYGLTEASPVTHVNPIWGRRKSGSIGLPLPDTDCHVVDSETDQPLNHGEIGELAVRGPQVMKGYWNRPEETAAVLKNGWLYTGDMATMDEEGYFYIVDRKKEVIVAGGYNVYPREVEEVLHQHEAILEAAVIGVEDAYRGETVKAFVVLKPDRTVDEKGLQDFCRERLAAFKVPHHYEFRTELPKSLIGKVLRRVLKEEEKQKAAPGTDDSQ